MRIKIFVISAILVMSCVSMLCSCTANQDTNVTDNPQTNTQQQDVLDIPVDKDAELASAESLEKLSDSFEELRKLYNNAVDTVSRTEGEVRENVKAIGAEITAFSANKLENPDYIKYADCVAEASNQIKDFSKRLKELVPSIA